MRFNKKIIEFLKFMTLPFIFLVLGFLFADNHFFNIQETESIVDAHFVKNNPGYRYKEPIPSYKKITKKNMRFLKYLIKRNRELLIIITQFFVFICPINFFISTERH